MVKICNYRKSSYNLRNESVRAEVLSLDILQKVILIDLLLILGSETDHLSIESLCDPSLYSLERASADE